MCGANVPLIYYSFPCDPDLRTAYFSTIAVLSAICAATTFHPLFRQPRLELVRVAIFGAVVVATFIPIVHGFVKYAAAEHFKRVALPGVLGTLGFNVLGGVVYAAKVPERWWPGRFDMWGSSHQLMHIAILLASGSYVVAVVGEFDYLHAHPGQCGQ
jgi:adiponectin receptor